MGTVYRGVHEKDGQIHAVKVLAPQYADDEHFRGRFESEIKAMMKLDHPNIVRLLSYGQEAGNLFFAMELVKGKSLYDMQRSGHAFMWPECLEIAIDICKGLKHAHDRGIIHRDLKPGNLLMTEEGVVKITDFGIAKSYGGSHHTGTNILGTMDFMAPEQAKGEPVTVRSDIYSLGTVMYTLMTGKPPFSANSMEESFRNLTRVPVPRISTKVANIPLDLEALLSKMLEKKPEKRIATAQATLYKILAIQEALKEESEARTAHHPGPPKTTRTEIVSPAAQTAEFPVKPVTESPDGEEGRSKSDSSITRLSFDGSKTVTDKTSIDVKPQVTDIDHKKSKSAARSKTQSDKTQSDKTPADKTSSQKIPDSELKPKAARTRKNTRRRRKGRKLSDAGEDYFTPVTDQHRAAVQLNVEPEPAESAKWPLAMLLLITVAAAAIGTWFATKNPSADELYATIEHSIDRPEEVVDQTAQFMQLYGDDDRFGEVELLNEVGLSIKGYTSLVKRLSVRARIPGDSRLTEIESQFLKIVALGETNPKSADAKMEAFINVHAKSKSLSDRDQDCVNAAEGFRIKIVGAEDRQVAGHIKSINKSIAQANSLPPEESAQLYSALIQLYADDNWGQRDADRIKLLGKVRDLYREAQKAAEGEPVEEDSTSE